MTSVSLTLDNVSPLISYSGAWRAGSNIPGPNFDPLFDRYSDGGTFAVSNTNGASATISFYGTQISVFGAKRENHDQFTTVIDGGNPSVSDGRSAVASFRQTLFASPILSNTAHTLTITVASKNADPAQSFFDLDYVTVVSDVDGAGKVQIEDNDSAAWQYGPTAQAWSTVPQQLASFSQGSGHSTSTPQATATFTFTGSAVDIYGLVCSSCGSYWVSVDGGATTPYTSFNQDWQKAKSLLFSARGLPDAGHNVTFTNLAASNGNTLALDYAVVYGASPAAGGTLKGATGNSNNGTSTGANESSNQKGASATPVGAIAGGVVGGLLIVIIGLLVLVWWMRRRRRVEDDSMVVAGSNAPQMGVAQPWQPPASQGPMTAGPYSASVYSAQPGAAGVGWGAAGGFAAAGAATGAAAYGAQHQQQQQYQQQQYQQFPQSYPQQYPQQYPQGMYGAAPVPTGPPSQAGSAGLAYLGGAQSDASGPSARPMSTSEFSAETPPDYHQATHNGASVPPMPVRRKN